MAAKLGNAALREIGTLFAVGTIGGLSDGQLIERFLSGPRDEAEAAFAALVDRHRRAGHGGMPSSAVRLERCRRRLPGHVPGPGQKGALDRPAGPAGQLALWGRLPDGAGGTDPCRPEAREGEAGD